MAARGSMALAMSRLLTMSMLVTWAAFAKAASTASFSPRCQSKQVFAATSSCTEAHPSATALFMSTTAGNTSNSTLIFSAASLAWPRVSAMTTATGSPTWRTLPAARTGCGGSAMGEPSLL